MVAPNQRLYSYQSERNTDYACEFGGVSTQGTTAGLYRKIAAWTHIVPQWDNNRDNPGRNLGSGKCKALSGSGLQPEVTITQIIIVTSKENNLRAKGSGELK